MITTPLAFNAICSGSLPARYWWWACCWILQHCSFALLCIAFVSSSFVPFVSRFTSLVVVKCRINVTIACLATITVTYACVISRCVWPLDRVRAACAALASKLKGIKAVFVSLALCRSLLFSLPHVQTHRLLQLSLPLKLIQMSMHSLDSSICIPHTPWSGGRVINRNDISLGDGRCPPNPMWTNPFHSHRNRSLARDTVRHTVPFWQLQGNTKSGFIFPRVIFGINWDQPPTLL